MAWSPSNLFTRHVGLQKTRKFFAIFKEFFIISVHEIPTTINMVWSASYHFTLHIGLQKTRRFFAIFKDFLSVLTRGTYMYQ